jgi:hypothetical protein
MTSLNMYECLVPVAMFKRVTKLLIATQICSCIDLCVQLCPEVLQTLLWHTSQRRVGRTRLEDILFM